MKTPRCPPLPALRSWQTARLRAYLRDTVLPFSAHYSALFRSEKIDPARIKTDHDLRRIPFTTKADFAPTAGEPDPVRAFVLQPDKRVLSRRFSTIISALFHGRRAVEESFGREFRPIFLTSTTGRSAEPVPFLFTEHDIGNLRLAGTRVMQVCDARQDMRMLNMLPFAPHLAFWLTHCAGTEFGVFVLSSGGGKTMGTEGNLRLMRKIRPDVIIGMPTFIYHVMTEAVREHIGLPNLKKIVLAGEKTPTGMRNKLRELARELGSARVDVLRTYGFTEAKMAWTECPYEEDAGSAGYHVHPDLALIEIVDPVTGEPRGEGEPGEIVFTPLDSRGSVVLRYRTGDVIDGGLFYEPCPFCGREVPRLVGEIARRSDVRDMRFDKIKGTLVDFNHLEHVLDNADHVGTWQLELRKLHDDPLEVDELVLHVSKSDGCDEQTLRKHLVSRFAAETEIHPNRVEFHTEKEMRELQGVGTALKEMRVVDHRPAANGASKTGVPHG
jgi:phenylacetate-coenzyme A ligase PaaK-like adenylate-forming protein